VATIPVVVERKINRGKPVIINFKLSPKDHGEFQKAVKSIKPNRVTMQKLLESFVRLFSSHPDSFLVIKKKKIRKVASMAEINTEINDAGSMIRNLPPMTIKPKEFKYFSFRYFAIRFVEGENVIHFSPRYHGGQDALSKFIRVIMRHIDPKTNKVDTVDFDKDYPLYAIVKDPLLLDVITDVLDSIDKELGETK
jgi:hypothetical protein